MTKIVTEDMKSFIVEDNARKATGSDYLNDDAPAVKTRNNKTNKKLFVDSVVIIFGVVMFFI